MMFSEDDAFRFSVMLKLCQKQLGLVVKGEGRHVCSNHNHEFDDLHRSRSLQLRMHPCFMSPHFFHCYLIGVNRTVSVFRWRWKCRFINSIYYHSLAAPCCHFTPCESAREQVNHMSICVNVSLHTCNCSLYWQLRTATECAESY